MSNRNSNLHKAKVAKNDEFYTQLTDIEKELKHYKEHFKDKVVLCNCDDPTWSAFWEYFHLNFKELGLKKLVSTHYEHSEFKRDLFHLNPTEDEITKSYKMEYEGGNDNDCSVGTRTFLKGDGDFRSPECIEILKECDIVVTNPPFSLFREFIATMVEYDKKFAVIGNKNSLTYKEVFPLFKENKLWMGYNSPNEFSTPDGTITKQVTGLCRWFTNLDVAKRHEKLILCKTYNPKEYPKYDNYDAINVDKVVDIPVDYDGVMGVPITFLDKFNPDEFEILGCHEPAISIEKLNAKGGYKEYKSRQIMVNDVLCQKTYHRIFISRK